MRLLTKKEKENIPSDLVWEKTEKADEFTYLVEAYDVDTKILYKASCDAGEYDILDWKFANLEDDIYAEYYIEPLS